MMLTLVGDSIFRRLYRAFPSHFCAVSKDLCVSGAGTQLLKGLVKQADTLTGTVVLLVGINDILRHRDVDTLWKLYASLVKTLIRRGCTVYCGLVLPLAHPRYDSFAPAIKRLNFLIKSICQSPSVRCVDFHSLFLVPEVGLADQSLYCSASARGLDYIHPNSRGLRKMLNVLCTLE